MERELGHKEVNYFEDWGTKKTKSEEDQNKNFETVYKYQDEESEDDPFKHF